ncbi:MAG: EAL domain-containing protein [Nitrosomonadales bacterium]|nr:EAL domain-containing protein [Nitrosomonadales bacterium]
MNVPTLSRTDLLSARILIVEDEQSHAEAMLRALEDAHWNNVEIVSTLREFKNRSIADPPALALLDLNLPDGRATDILTQPADQGQFPLVIMTSHSDQQTIVDAMKHGAFDYMLKSHETFLELPLILSRILRDWEINQERIELLNEARAIYELSLDLICVANLQGYFLRINPAFNATLGYSEEELCGQPFRTFIHPDDLDATKAELSRLSKGHRTHSFSCRFRTKQNQYRWLEWNAILASKGDRIYAVARDVTERKLAEERIHHLAFYDALTLLPNRRLLTDRLRHAMATSHRSQEYAALLFIDLDNFKALNDTQGHNVGDLMLIEVTRRLQHCVRDVDTVARLGGDEFVVLLESLSNSREAAANQAMLVGEKIREATAQAYDLNTFEYHGSSSIGISLFRGEDIGLDDLLKHADTAMYQAKDAGRNALRFFDPKMQADLEERSMLEKELRHVLKEQQLRLYYQAQVDVQGKVVGAESLLRWPHPQHGWISPMQFIPIAETTGMIVPIGEWVLQTACAQLNAWRDNPSTAHFQLAVNVSARQFRQPDFVARVLDLLGVSGINPQLLKLELTESLVLDNINSCISKMNELRNAGIRFSMDDFGTGQSSLTYLKRLPLDQLKIDQSFVRDITHDEGNAAIVKTIIMMAQNLGIEVIAEGVETEAQRNFLMQNNCNLYQGYLFAKPVPIADFRTAL